MSHAHVVVVRNIKNVVESSDNMEDIYLKKKQLKGIKRMVEELGESL